jgi:hypothetical protein
VSKEATNHAIRLLKAEGLVTASRGRRAHVSDVQTITNAEVLVPRPSTGQVVREPDIRTWPKPARSTLLMLNKKAFDAIEDKHRRIIPAILHVQHLLQIRIGDK